MKHLKEMKMSYFQHLLVALRYSFELSIAAMILVIHAFVPCWFESTGSKIVKKIHGRMMNHGQNSVEV